MAERIGFDHLHSAIAGGVIEPHDSGYDAARSVWNGMIDRSPAAIARCGTSDDVARAVSFARSERVPVSVRGGGHGVAGSAVCDGGLLIDLAQMNSIDVDPESRTASVGGGAKLGELDRATQAHGLAVTAGIDPGTGVGGLTLGGGMGFLARRLGLTIDNLIGAQVVLADGSLVEANERQHPDLFWALRGGGGNFGIVTRFDFRLHPIAPELMTAQIFFAPDCSRDVLRGYRDFIAAAPDEVGCYALMVPLPPLDAFARDLHGRTVVAIAACHSGDREEGERLLNGLAELGEPLVSMVQPMAYAELQSSFKDAAPDGERYYWKSHFLSGMADELIDLVVERAETLPGPFSNTFFEPMGGAIARVGETETAFSNRNAAFTIGISSGWSDAARDADAIAWTRDFHDAVTPFSTGGVYTNYMDFDEKERVSSAYGANYERLRQVKRSYDPENLFRMNQNIPPAAQPASL